MNDSAKGTSPSSQARPRYFGKYLLLEKIGSGGMAEIFKAVLRGAQDVQKVVVIKRILMGYSRDPSFVKMFVEEARITAPLQHSNIVTIYEFDEVDGQYYLAMELVNGKDLQRIMARVNKMGRAFAPELAVHVTSEVCKALWYAYNARDVHGNPLRIIHRDVSPSNILISYDGEVKVSDFGVAKAATSGGGDGPGQGLLKGKLGYMSPEQVAGLDLDHRSDLFSLGIILFECLTLKRLFLGRSDLQTLINVRDADVEKRLARHPEIDPALADILRKALAKDRDRRYRNALDFQKDLDDWLFSRGHRVGSAQVGLFLRDLFPEEAEQDLLPLDVEESTGLRSGRALSEVGDGKEGVGRPAASGPVPVVPEPRRSTGPVPLPSTQEVSGPLDMPAPATRNTRLDPQNATFRIRDAEGNIFGPISFANMLSLLESRSITEEEYASMNEGEWVRVGDIAAVRGEVQRKSREASRRTLMFEGTVEPRGLVGLAFRVCGQQRLTGMLMLKQGPNQKEVYVVDGRPKFIYSNLKSELLGEYLVRNRTASREALEKALALSGKGAVRLGDALVAQGMVGAHELAQVLQVQFRERFLQIFGWTGGWYGFYENTPLPQGVVPMDLPPIEMITEAVRRNFDLSLLRSYLRDSESRRLAPSEGSRIDLQDLKFQPREMRLVHLLDQQPTIEALKKALPATPEQQTLIYRVVFLLVESGIYRFRGTATMPPIR
ncbi:MAG TPA: serine/threonine-protein kinase [Myxococcota bacterium]|nr:serine/threonine-protein kinase [Myxococcota bacterium]HQK51788.1 serine/threonine-protein kinase [Myxococcota bacterium]